MMKKKLEELENKLNAESRGRYWTRSVRDADQQTYDILHLITQKIQLGIEKYQLWILGDTMILMEIK